MDGAVGTLAARAGSRDRGELQESVVMRRNEPEEGGPRERTPAGVCCGLCGSGQCATFIGRCGDGTPASMPRYSGHLNLRAHETGDGPLDIP
jgi:hypothetical protein